jgi:hypothetical protein
MTGWGGPPEVRSGARVTALGMAWAPVLPRAGVKLPPMSKEVGMEQRSGVRPGRGMIWLTMGVLLGLAVLFGAVGGHAERSGPSKVSAPRSARVEAPKPEDPATARRVMDRRIGGRASARTGREPQLRPGDDRDYDTLFARLGPLAGKDNVAATLLMREAVAVCRHPLEPGWQSRVVEPRAVAFSNWKEGFCSRAVSEAEQDAIGEQGKDVFVRRHPEWHNTGPRSTDEVLDAVASSDDVEVVDMALAQLPRDGKNRWAMGRDLVQGSAYEADLPKYQRVALEDMECAATGGCGPGGMRSAMVCLTSDGFECAPGQGAYDMWNEQLSPREIDIVLAIEQRILDERARLQDR